MCQSGILMRSTEQLKAFENQANQLIQNDENKMDTYISDQTTALDTLQSKVCLVHFLPSTADDLLLAAHMKLRTQRLRHD